MQRLAEGDAVRVPVSESAVRIPPHLERGNATGERLWIQRAMIEEAWLERTGPEGTWRSPVQMFFQPDEADASFPVGYAFDLPAGVRDVDLMVRTQASVVLRPRVQSAEATDALQQRGGALAGANYASLAVLSLMALSLFAAVRDRVYLALLAFCASAFGWFVAANGIVNGRAARFE